MFALGAALAAPPAEAQQGPEDGLLFRVSADKDLVADTAGGAAIPNFQSGVSIVPDGAIGSALRWSDAGYVAWQAPGNIYAQRGTLAFFWRPRTPVGEAPFVIFRTGFADHSSWDMAFLRIDWNGHGFDAFVTDANLSRLRVSWRMETLPPPDQWLHLAFAWDETRGVRLFVDGREVARMDATADLDSGLDQLGLAGRVLSPHQVQSRYNFMRGSDLDEIRVYDHMLSPASIAALARKTEPAPDRAPDTAARRQAWLHRYGWDAKLPPPLDAPVTTIRKIEFADAKDLKEWMWKGVDGIRETTWPGVYNRSRLPGRTDYFILPDWNVYVQGGKRYDLTLPEGARFNRVELRGAAYGALSWTGPDGKTVTLADRPEGMVRSVTHFAARTGGTLHFTNEMQEQPIQEIWAYDVHPGAAPAGTFTLDYRIDAQAAPGFAALDRLNRYIAGRYPAGERTTVVALPASGVKVAAGAGSAADSGTATRQGDAKPIVHILIASSFGDAPPGKPLARAWDYGWENLHDGLDGIAISLPALDLPPLRNGLIPLDIRIKDPIWPGRDMIDVTVSVRPHEARTVWLDLRDRILPNDSLYLSIASGAPGFDAAALDGAGIRLVFKDRAEALKEHVADRFNQVKDNWAFLVEEHTASKREGLYQRLYADITDLLRVDPNNAEARRYWADIDYRPENMPPFTQPTPPAGVPLWAFRQLEDLKRVRYFVDWWIDERQVPYGDFGGGISDDTDLTQQWPGLALMGVDPDKINVSLRALSEAAYRNGMHTNGLATITTDELHAYEEGMNADAERLYLNWGEPKTVERLMRTTKALTGVILRNKAGHLHFASNWYGGTKMYREDAWAWQKPYSFVVTHAPILMGVYNGNPTAEGLITGLMDGWAAHATKGADGGIVFPNEINWNTDEVREGDGGGANTPLQSAWAAWRFTGDEKYLAPIRSRLASSGPGLLAQFNENAFEALPDGKAYEKALIADAHSNFARYAAWQASGDKSWLEALHADAIEDKAEHQYMVTEGHWWSDRVEAPSDILQRERLGGIALQRNQTWPGNTVSWRFADPEGAVKVAILVPGATRKHFRVLGYNVSDGDLAATMSTWNVVAGRWRMRVGTSDDGGKTVTWAGAPRELTLERSAATDVHFVPGKMTVLDFTLIASSTPTNERPDLGIGVDDVAIEDGAVTLTVHSLGAKPVVGGRAVIENADGRIIASAPIGALDAPIDLMPRTQQVRIATPGALPSEARVRIAIDGDAPEVTRRNNVIALADVRGR
jgi:hypothetical protein